MEVWRDMITSKHVSTTVFYPPWSEEVKALKKEWEYLLMSEKVLRGSPQYGRIMSVHFENLDRVKKTTLNSIHRRNMAIRTLSLCLREFGGFPQDLIKKIDSYLF